MIGNRPLLPFAPLVLAALLLGCTQKNTGDEAAATDVPTGLERFLLFPNPIAQNTGGFETDTRPYAEAYYRAIDDPANAKDTLDKWKAANLFGTTGNGTEQLVVFRDTKDLGYGRRMTGRKNTHADPKINGSVAFFVENYGVEPNSSGNYSSTLNVEAAIRRDTQWHVGTSAIEWSTATCTSAELAEGCNPNVKFAKFYNFSADGTRQLLVDLDGKGMKAMPGPCITCHGGRGDPLTPGEGNPLTPRFPLVGNNLSGKRGDVQGRLHGLNVGSFGFSAQAGFTRANQEDKLRDFNQWVLCTYPLPGGGGTGEDACRPTAGPNEWQGTAAEMIKSWYGPGMTGTFSDNPPYVPGGWSGNPSLYTDVVAPFCRTCHIVRGTPGNGTNADPSDTDFTSLAKFQSFAERTRAHVFDRGTMPLAVIVYEDFWRSSAPQTLANYIDSVLGAQAATSSSGAPLRPGRPIANPGPDRMVKRGVNATLSAEDSLFATTYNWSATGPDSPQFGTFTSPRTTFLAMTAGEYTVTLKLNGGASPGSTKTMKVTVNDTFPDPSTLKFAHVRSVLLNSCTATCHTGPGNPAVAGTPPIFFNSTLDRNGDGVPNTTADDDWFYKELTGRVNLTEVQASPLLGKSSGSHHFGGASLDVADTTSGGGLSNYSILYNWILAGMPPGGVLANIKVNGSSGAPASAVLTFGGTFPGPYSATIALDGSASIGATSYQWSLVPGGPPGTINPATATSSSTTLTVFDVGTYVVQLDVNGGGDIQQRTITVSETAIAASFSPPSVGSTAVPFASSASRGNVTLTSIVTGSPISCRWEILAGANATLGIFPTILTAQTRACSSPATLSVPFAASAVYQIRLTAFNAPSNDGLHSDTHNFTVTNGTPATASIALTNGTSFPFSGNPPSASVTLSGAASSGVQPLSYAWSITQQAPGAVVASAITTGASTSTLTARATGTYIIRLQITDAASSTDVTTSTFTVTPSRNTTFASITTLLGPVASGGIGCTTCHSGTGNPAVNSGTAPSFLNVTGADGSSLWTRVSARAFNGSTLSNTLLLNPRNVTDATFNPNGHVAGGCQTGFGCGVGTSANLTLFQNWTQDGSPPGN